MTVIAKVGVRVAARDVDKVGDRDSEDRERIGE